MAKPTYYKLEGHEIVPCTIDEWADFMESDERVVQQTTLGEVLVSTIFSCDIGLHGGPGLPFETMIFGGVSDGAQRRYASWDSAEAGHWEIVQKELAGDTER